MTGAQTGGSPATATHGWGEPSPEQLAWSARRRLRDRVFLGLCISVAATTVAVLAILLLSILVSGWPRIAQVNEMAWSGDAVVAAPRSNLHVNVPRETIEVDESGGGSAEVTFAQPVDRFTDELVGADEAEQGQLKAEQEEARRIVREAGLQYHRAVSPPRALNPLTPEGVEVVERVNGELPEGYSLKVQTRTVRLDEEEMAPAGFLGKVWRYTDFGNFLTTGPSREAWNAGLMPSMWGSVMIIIVCALSALPLGVGTAVFLEEFKPTHPLARRVHSFVELNIRNLAGVPSIVYGILGLTIFVQMFGVFGTQQAPAFEVGAEHYVQVLDQGGNLLKVPMESATAPLPELTDGTLAVYDDPETGEREVTIKVYSFENIASAAGPDGTMPVGTMAREVIEATPLQRSADRSAPYYLRLPFGRSVLAGGLTLMLVVLPVVIISAQEALRGVPNSLREGALAAGATRWQMVSRMTLPASVPGIMTGSILAMSRAIGEAAPILVIAGVVFILFRPQNLMDDFTAMPLQIYNWAGQPQAAFHEVAATGIVVLLVILLSFNALAVVIRQKFQKPLQ